MVFVIAEIGVNHNGSLETAKELVTLSKAVGANAVKFQAFTPVALDPPGARRDMLKKLRLTPFDLYSLADYCKGVNIEFMATPFDVKWLKDLASTGIRRIKISSSSIDDVELLTAATKIFYRNGPRLPVILSTGLANKTQIERALEILSGGDVTLMHCVSEYPTPIENVNLHRLSALKAFGTRVGLSDHSTSIYPAIAAVAMGATVIEKHITFDRTADGPDHKASIDPLLFEDMVRGIREIEKALGDGSLEPKAPQEIWDVKKGRDEWRSALSEMEDTAGAYLPSQAQDAFPF